MDFEDFASAEGARFCCMGGSGGLPREKNLRLRMAEMSFMAHFVEFVSAEGPGFWCLGGPGVCPGKKIYDLEWQG